MDPKVYLPFLNCLHGMEEPLKRFEIDVQLKKPASALGHLAAAGSSYYQQANKFLIENNLYATGMKLFEDTVSCR